MEMRKNMVRNSFDLIFSCLVGFFFDTEQLRIIRHVLLSLFCNIVFHSLSNALDLELVKCAVMGVDNFYVLYIIIILYTYIIENQYIYTYIHVLKE